jgi:trehalose-6-phosphate synthase
MADSSGSSSISSDSDSVASSKASPKDVEAPDGNVSMPIKTQKIVLTFLRLKRNEGMKRQNEEFHALPQQHLCFQTSYCLPHFQTCLVSRERKKKRQRRARSNTTFYQLVLSMFITLSNN